MATASIGGLASGLDTASIIDQLMQLEAIPQSKLQNQVTTEQSKVSALQKVNTALATLAAVAKGLATSSSTSGVWGTLKTTSSNSVISATAGTGAVPASLTVRVDAVATSGSAEVRGLAVDANSTFTLYRADGTAYQDADGADLTFTTDSDPSLAEVAAKINATAVTTGLQAVVVHGSVGGVQEDVLQIRSTNVGAESNFTISNGSQTLTGSGGANGQITVNGVTIEGTSNTYKNAVEGVDLTVATTAVAGDESTVTIVRDAGARSAAVKTLVDNINSVLDMIGTQSAANGTDPTKSGVLAGDQTVRQAANSLLESIWPGGTVSLAQFGVSLTRDGRYSFDDAAFSAAYAADPEAVTKAFAGADGLGARIQRVAEAASDKYDGYLTTAIAGRTTTITRLNDSIEAWDDRLELRRTTLEKQYTALETALSQLNSQSAWLSSQLASLTSTDS